MIKIYSSNFLNNPANCLYSNEIEVHSIDDFKKAVSKDYVCAKYKDDYRNKANFIESNLLMMDCDNDHSENESEWVKPQDVVEAFPGVKIYIHFSRNNLVEKNGKKARYKFHAGFEIEPINDPQEYERLKQKVLDIFPYFDNNAKDAARFFFGVENPNVEIIGGEGTLTDFLDEIEFENYRDVKISEGSRNSTMSHYAGRIIKKYGDTEKGWNAFIEVSKKCEPPLSDDELKIIWNSARKFYQRILEDKNYVSPEAYNDDDSYMPKDFTDVGQAEVLAEKFQCELRYSPATKFIRYREHYWQESEPGAQAIAQELTRRQLKEANIRISRATDILINNGGMDLVNQGKKGIANMGKEQNDAFEEYNLAQTYHSFVLGRRKSKNIDATLRQAQSILEIKPSDLNKDPFLLCTPKATYDLRYGLKGAREHDPNDFITKITNVSPSDKGKELWLDSLNKIFSNDKELIDYVQKVCGLAAIGKVFVEALIISYGEGGNGKSTFWNSIFRVLGLYSGKISADTLTVGCKRNVKPEMAEMNGRRLLIASESQEGARLNDGLVKQLCSTDEVFAEKKYKDPFYFTPSHTLVLYTNHLPKVSGSDDGIWRRLIVIPFVNKFTGASDIKNFADYLYEHAGEYILTWIIEGAKKVIDCDYHLDRPKCVEEAIGEYREMNNWFRHFLDDCCEIDPSYEVSSNELYIAYRRYCSDLGEFARSTTDFYTALENNKFGRFIKRRIKYIRGLKLKDEPSDFEDFLN